MPISTLGLTQQSVASGAVDGKVDAIYEWEAAFLTLSSTGGTLTADGTEQTLYIDNEPLGVFAPVALVLDLDNMQGGDTIEVRVYHRMTDAGSLKLLAYHSWTGADGGLSNSEKLDHIDLIPNRHGWQLTLQQSAGTNREYPWELFLSV